jgi:hypothetical protein
MTKRYIARSPAHKAADLRRQCLSVFPRLDILRARGQ